MSTRLLGSLELLFDRLERRWSVELHNMCECMLAIVFSILQKSIGEHIYIVYAMRIRCIGAGVSVGIVSAF